MNHTHAQHPVPKTPEVIGSVIRLLFAFCLVAMALPPAALCQQPQTAPNRFKLKVVLFPYIPDTAEDRFAKLSARIKREFQAKDHTVELEIRPMAEPDDKLDLYAVETANENSIGSLLAKKIDQGGYHLAEIDAVILGSLIEANLVRPWADAPGTADWHPAGLAAVRAGSMIFGVPHWLCGHFIFTRDEQVAAAKTNAALVAALDKSAPGDPNLAGRLTGRWNLPSLYLDAYADTYGFENLSPAVSPRLDAAVLKGLRALAGECKQGDTNPCMAGDYNNADVPAYRFADGKAKAAFGYSERLFYIRKRAGTASKVLLTSAPIGEGDHPLLFTDAFVLRSDCDGVCQAAAKSFVDYMNSPETMEWILTSGDAPAGTMARYLIPATMSAYGAPKLAGDPYYQAIKAAVANGRPFPSFGFYRAHEDMAKAISEELKKQ